MRITFSRQREISPDQCHARSSPFDGTPPPHFYGELVKTDEGCDILRDSGHFDDFAAIISLHAESDFDQEFIETLKSVLWAVVRPRIPASNATH